MKRLLRTFVLLATLASLPAFAQQAREFGEYAVHYNALSSSLITPEIARAYGIRRSDSRGLINISVMKNNGDNAPSAVQAGVTVTGRNLTGQTRNVDMRVINEGEGAIYYIGELTVRNMETFDFTVTVTPEGQSATFEFEFRQQFYTE